MKKLGLLLVLVILATLLIGCGPNDEKCTASLRVMTYYEVRPLTIYEFQMIMNSNHAPGTVGQMLFDCIEGGWQGWR